MKKKWKIKTIIVGLLACISLITVSALVYNVIVPDKIIEDNGYYEGTGKFDKEKTPVANMLLLLKVLNGSNFCDDDWYAEVLEVQGIMQKQIDQNRMDSDPYVSKIMDLQTQIVKNLRSITTSAWVSMLSDYEINQIQKSYDAYHDFYYQNYGTGEEI